MQDAGFICIFAEIQSAEDVKIYCALQHKHKTHYSHLHIAKHIQKLRTEHMLTFTLTCFSHFSADEELGQNNNKNKPGIINSPQSPELQLAI